MLQRLLRQTGAFLGVHALRVHHEVVQHWIVPVHVVEEAHAARALPVRVVHAGDGGRAGEPELAGEGARPGPARRR